MESLEIHELEHISSYSIGFWLSISKSEKNKQVTVFKKGSSSQNSPLISLQERTLFIKVDIDRMRSECLFSSLELPLKKWVFVVFVLRETDIIEASLYINGTLDSEVSVARVRDSERLSGSSKIYIGKDPWNHGLFGSISEPCFYMKALDLETISNMYSFGQNNFKDSQSFKTTTMFYSMTQERPQSALPPTARVPKVLENSPRKSRKENFLSNLTVEQRLDGFFDRNQNCYLKATQLVQYADWLIVFYRILRLCVPAFRDEEGNFQNKIEVNRMMPALSQFRLPISKKEIIEIAKLMRVHQLVQKEDFSEDVILFVDFFETLKKYIENLETGDLSLVSRDEIDQREKINNLIARADEWYSTRNGNFEVCIDFCANCKKHQTSTWHDSNEFIQWYNDIVKDLSDEFPGLLVTGNKYGAPTIGVFAVYLEYLGTESSLDRHGRHKLYKIKNSKPSSREILDKLYLMCYIYEDCNELGRIQNENKRRFGEKDRHSESVQGPASISPEVRGVSTARNPIELEPDTEMFCRNWGCLSRLYAFGKNHKRACNFHPGRWEFGSIHGLWPENWTCCRGNWDSAGCVYGFHRGVANSKVMKKCINRGELNPKSQKPDSVCGCNFPDPATCGKKYQVPRDCRYHSGHVEARGASSYVWTCCKVEFNPNFPDDSFCVEEVHRFEEWPNEEAKIYFVTKFNSKGKVSFSEAAKRSRFFNNDIKPYVNPYAVKKEKEALEGENRYCLNWTCERVYKECDNHDRACKSHTGYWDFGHSGILKDGQTIILWEPHWRCCGGKWEDPGCTLVRHNGPLVSKMEDRKWKWPSEGAKRYFLKKISNLWQQKLQGEHLSRKEVALRYDQFCAEIGSKSLPGSMLHRFALILHLHILCVSEDLSFMFKYQDVISKQAENLLSDKTGYIDKDTFLEWWFAPLERIRPEMAIT